MVSALVLQENLGIKLPPTLVWSPDSTRFFTHQLDQRKVGLMHLVRSSPKDGGRPKPLSYHYALPGDEHGATAEYFVFEAEAGRSRRRRNRSTLTSSRPSATAGCGGARTRPRPTSSTPTAATTTASCTRWIRRRETCGSWSRRAPSHTCSSVRSSRTPTSARC